MQPLTPKARQQLHDRQLLGSTTRHQQEPYFLDDGRCYYPITTPQLGQQATARQLYRPRRCYVCKQHFWFVHHFYHQLCPTCATYNFEQRSLTADISGRIALVTGGRIKIGFEVALKLLRAGATVHVTTRFPHDAALRFAQQTDYATWASRLTLHCLDLKNLAAVEMFCDYLLEQLPHLDILIHNAAQTIKKPHTYFAAMALREHLGQQQLTQSCLPSVAKQGFLDQAWQVQQQQYPLIVANTADIAVDEFAEPVDLAATSSWGLTLASCSTEELVETQVINAMAPFVISSRLKSLLMRSPHWDRFIINVSAMEGQFNRENKTCYHPHTNMAKASLNMLTRTSAQDYARDRIWMHSVDTGWITQEHPLPKKNRHRAQGIVPPLDCVDGAARILHPIWQTVRGQSPVSGQFWKDYQVTNW